MFKDDNSGRYDGVHMYGSAGKQAYTESVINILLSAAQAIPANNDDHTKCPQTKYQKGKYSSVVAGKSNIKTQNRFFPLAEQLGN